MEFHHYQWRLHGDFRVISQFAMDNHHSKRQIIHRWALFHRCASFAGVYGMIGKSPNKMERYQVPINVNRNFMG